MTTHTCPPTIRLARPLHERLLEAVADAATTLQKAWRRHAERRRLERELEAVADMNEALLRDIGAPDWMLGQALARRDADRQRLLEMQMGLPRHD